MALGDRIVDENTVFEVVWCGEADRQQTCFSLTGDYRQKPSGGEKVIKRAERIVGTRWTSTFKKAKREVNT